MYAIVRKEKVSGKLVCANLDFDCISNTWRHVDGIPGNKHFIFPDKKAIIFHMENNGLIISEWEVLKEA